MGSRADPFGSAGCLGRHLGRQAHRASVADVEDGHARSGHSSRGQDVPARAGCLVEASTCTKGGAHVVRCLLNWTDCAARHPRASSITRMPTPSVISPPDRLRLTLPACRPTLQTTCQPSSAGPSADLRTGRHRRSPCGRIAPARGGARGVRHRVAEHRLGRQTVSLCAQGAPPADALGRSPSCLRSRRCTRAMAEKIPGVRGQRPRTGGMA